MGNLRNKQRDSNKSVNKWGFGINASANDQQSNDFILYRKIQLTKPFSGASSLYWVWGVEVNNKGWSCFGVYRKGFGK